jgi:hypothetical protein
MRPLQLHLQSAWQWRTLSPSEPGLPGRATGKGVGVLSEAEVEVEDRAGLPA